MKVLKVEPYQLPEVKEIDSGLSSLQHEVKGWIEATYPFEDPVAIICNEEGKLLGLPYNFRKPNDIIVGTVIDDSGYTANNLAILIRQKILGLAKLKSRILILA